MKKYTLIPKGSPEGLTDLVDEVETNGKLVLPMVDGEYTLIVEGITTEEARLFRKAQANLEAADQPTPATSESSETLPGRLLPPADFTIEDITRAAEAAHEANRVYCQSIGDMSQPAWADAPDWQKESALNGVAFAVDNGFPPPERMHENWMEKKIAKGWVYGEVKDPDAKTHPCIKPYAELPEEQRRKDAIFRETIIAALGAQP